MKVVRVLPCVCACGACSKDVWNSFYVFTDTSTANKGERERATSERASESGSSAREGRRRVPFTGREREEASITSSW